MNELEKLDKFSAALWSAWYEEMYALGFDCRWVPLTKKFYPEYTAAKGKPE
jgi:mannose/fructose/N-acetylgalactosamine-specific phosphotransferase system component IID